MKHYINPIFLFSSFLVIVSLVYANYWSSFFWQASMVNVVTIFIACFITYYWKGQKDNAVRRDSCIESIINEIEVMTMLPEIISDKKTIALSKQVACANRIKYLKDACFVDIKDDIDFIDEHFEQMRNLYSPSTKEMRKNLDKFKKQQELVAARCVKIRIGLYAKKNKTIF